MLLFLPTECLIWGLACSLLQFFPSAEESINHYNLKRCAGSSCLELPSQLVSDHSLHEKTRQNATILICSDKVFNTNECSFLNGSIGAHLLTCVATWCPVIRQRYVKYYEQVSKKYHGCTPTGRKCTLRSIRLNNCPAWIRPSVTVSDHNGTTIIFRSESSILCDMRILSL